MTDFEHRGYLPPELSSTRDVHDARPNLGILPTLYRRMVRYFGGDPVQKFLRSSTGTADVKTLQDHPLAVTAVLFVSGGNIIYSVDGTTPDPAGTDVIQSGSRITLSGMPSIKGFQFASAGAFTTTISCTYFD